MTMFIIKALSGWIRSKTHRIVTKGIQEMRFEDFLEALDKAGWGAVGDAQHSKIEKLWREMFPVVAAMHDEITELESDIKEYVDAQPPI
jgi:hypothetical protein